jgi:glycerophosphoryl diester phosphodiesterase
VIIHHDKAIIIEGKDPINLSKLNIEEIKKLILPNGDKILTLREFFEKYADKKSLKGKLLEFSIDLQDLKVGTAIIPILEEFNVIDRTVLCGTTTITLKKVRKKYDSVNIRLVASNLQEQICDERLNSSSKIAQLSLYAFNIQFDNFNVEMKHITEKFNLKLFIWDLHTEDVLHKYLSFKPDAVFSNFPDIAVKIRDEMFNL